MICDTGAQNPLLVVFDFFYSTISYTASASNAFYRIKISCF